MKLVVGLGNPGKSYEKTRHNVGWWLVDHLADVWGFEGWRRDGDAVIADGRRAGQRVRLMKPQTYMNLSGIALRSYLRRESWSAASDLLVVVDEVALPLGKFRVRAHGSPGGHNGLKSIEAAVGGPGYARLRIGIKPLEEARAVDDLSDFVLGPFGKGERATLADMLPTLTEAVDVWVKDGALAAMNAFNRR